jgi:hypothetical protein
MSPAQRQSKKPTAAKAKAASKATQTPRPRLGRMARPVGSRKEALKAHVVAQDARPTDRRGRIWA